MTSFKRVGLLKASHNDDSADSAMLLIMLPLDPIAADFNNKNAIKSQQKLKSQSILIRDSISRG